MKKQWENVDIEATKEVLEERYGGEVSKEELETHFSEENLDEVKELVQEGPSVGGDWERKSKVLNCWHINETESNLMWQAYSDDKGIAMKSSIERMRDAFEAHKENDIFIGKVDYINYENSTIPEHTAFFPFLHKRAQFKGESELLAIISSTPTSDEPPEDGPKNARKIEWSEQPREIRVSVGLNELIEAIYVAPGTSEEIADTVRVILSDNNLSPSLIQRSSIDGSPPDRT